ncbi:unnamed protein product [Pseudo-nitzschia multistriata]|uniref:DnaJ-like protein C11 C-terminal domain-containing protein n=1 Tax=Pseudo-nitzschia multistriata TaxID=183589 RepID=A0A448ZSG3_9STRA|nr:unnamed protein product [Pseudo-nitzschia multistriata]
MKKKELDFERIARQAREFREQEEKRIASEKEDEARRIAAEKEAERERIAQAHEETLLNAEHSSIGSSHSYESRAPKPSPGTVKRRTEWLRNLAKDAAEHRHLEEEFNSMLVARLKRHPNEAAKDAEAAVKAALTSSSPRDDFDRDIEKLRDQTAHIAKEVANAERRLRKGSEDLIEEFNQIEADLEMEIAEYQTPSSDANSSDLDIEGHEVNGVKPRDLMEEYSHSDAPDLTTVESMTMETIEENIDAPEGNLEPQGDSDIEKLETSPGQQIHSGGPEYGAEADPAHTTAKTVSVVSKSIIAEPSTMETTEENVDAPEEILEPQRDEDAREIQPLPKKKSYSNNLEFGAEADPTDITDGTFPIASKSTIAESTSIETLEENFDVPEANSELQDGMGVGIIQMLPKQQMHSDGLEYGAQADPRTQALLAEDDLVPTGKKYHADENLRIKDRNKKSIVLDGSIPVDRKIFRRNKSSSKNYEDEDGEFGSEFVHKEATFELPMELTENGLKLSSNTAEVNMITTIPPSRLDGRISGILEGRSTLGPHSNTASGSLALEYKSSKQSRLTLGMIRGCEPHHPLITIGGRLLRQGTSVGVIFYHNAQFLHQMLLEHSLWAISFRHSFPNSRWTLSSQLSRRKDLSLSLVNGNKLSGLIGWNLLKPKQFHARFDARPKLTEYRRAHLYCQWKASPGPGLWNVGLSLVQSLHSQIATVGLGCRLFSTKGLEWVISWSRGNSTISIPILLSKSMAPSTTIGQTFYFSLISFMMQEYIAETWGWIGNDSEDDEDCKVEDASIALRAQNLAKARQDAVIQKELMARQARRKTKEEKEKDGLIIIDAIYKVENGEEWSVTVPLQFWVTNSTLTLPARPKSELLGFYDVAAPLKNSRVSSIAGNQTSTTSSSSGRCFPTLSELWHDLLDRTPEDSQSKKSEISSPTLTVSYEFRGKPHVVTIKDRDELRLPQV